VNVALLAVDNNSEGNAVANAVIPPGRFAISAASTHTRSSSRKLCYYYLNCTGASYRDVTEPTEFDLQRPRFDLQEPRWQIARSFVRYLTGNRRALPVGMRASLIFISAHLCRRRVPTLYRNAMPFLFCLLPGIGRTIASD